MTFGYVRSSASRVQSTQCVEHNTFYGFLEPDADGTSGIITHLALAMPILL